MRRYWLLAFFVFAGFGAGCKPPAFLANRFQDFAAYYNRFYNAQEAFREGLKNIERPNDVVNRDEYIRLFIGAESASGGNFEKVIKKSADLLRAYPRSKWADDAILLIGKAYFYQGEYLGAEQKFNEVIQTPDSPLRDEARFWQARTLISAKSYDRALALLSESLLIKDLKPKWGAYMQLALGELFVRQKDWTKAAEALEKGLERSTERELSAKATYLLGQVYETQQAWTKAASAYRKVPQYRPSYELIYAAQISEAEVAGLNIRPELGMAVIRKLVRDDKFIKERAEILLLQGRIMARMGQSREAYTLFDDLLYNPNRNANAVKGKVHYALASMYRDQFRNYRRAGAHFDTASTNLRTGIGEEGRLRLPKAITDAARQAATYKSFNKSASRVFEIDSLLWVSQLNRKSFDSLLTVVRARKEKEQAALQAEAERRRAESQFASSQQQRTNNTSFGRPGESQPGGFLGHLDPIRVQEGKNNFKQRWGDRPLAPNWRRKAAIGNLNEGQGAKQDSLRIAEKARLLAQAEKGTIQIDTSSVPRTAEARKKLLEERAQMRYDVGNILFLSINLPDSAAVWYRKVIDDNRTSPVAQRAYFALAEVQQVLKDTTSAERLYRFIVDEYAGSDFAVRARERLGLPAEDRVVTDTLVIAEKAYQRAYTSWEQGAHQTALSDLLALVQQYPKSPVTPKAMLAAGQIYTEWATLEKQDLYGIWPFEFAKTEPPLPDSIQQAKPDKPRRPLPQPLTLETLYKNLAEQYPTSPYGKQAQLLGKALTELKPKPATPPQDSTAVVPQADEAHTNAVPEAAKPPANPKNGEEDVFIRKTPDPTTQTGNAPPTDPTNKEVDERPMLKNAQDSADKLPQFPGGQTALMAFIKDNLKYPEEAVEKKIEGAVFIRFTVDDMGKAQAPEVVSGIGAGCDEEAIRLVSLMPKWEVGILNGKPATQQTTIQILFNLPSDK
ncbi:MAG: tetratricopeptide repeat protein [Bacteroidetes Order II. Incertae sedis bacterium]|nr:tetratricopeptide repeat protein [Bacteroidetes Order II. bacterium]